MTVMNEPPKDGEPVVYKHGYDYRVGLAPTYRRYWVDLGRYGESTCTHPRHKGPGIRCMHVLAAERAEQEAALAEGRAPSNIIAFPSKKEVER